MNPFTMEHRATEWNLVIKAKHGDTLKRFNICVTDQFMDYNMAKLTQKIRDSFKFDQNSNLTFTYTDEDGDTVTLSDNADLHDAIIKQRLNPLRINVSLTESKSQTPISYQSRDSFKQPMDVDANGESKIKGPINVSYYSPKLGQSQTFGATKSNQGFVYEHGAPSGYTPLCRSRVSRRSEAGPTVHVGIICDGCEMNPILGPRYKSNVRINFDLCNTCFIKTSNKGDYTRIDTVEFNPLSATAFPHWMTPVQDKLESCFVRDVTIPAGTRFPPSTPFTKIWYIQNNGTSPWPYGTRLVWVGGDQLASVPYIQLDIPLTGFPLNEKIDIAVDFLSPPHTGRYVSYWNLSLPSGKMFGQKFWVLIEVVGLPRSSDNTVKSVPVPNIPPAGSNPSPNPNPNPNLNCSPSPNGVTTVRDSVMIQTPQSIHVYPSSMTFSHPVSTPPAVTSHASSPVRVSDGVTIPIPQSIDFFPTSSMVIPLPLSTPPLGASFVSSPVLDETVGVSDGTKIPSPQSINFCPTSSGMIPIPVSTPPVVTSHVSSPVRDERDGVLEEILLKELEEMGFKQADLNREILRLNKYNFELCVEDLCDYAVWDPLTDKSAGHGILR